MHAFGMSERYLVLAEYPLRVEPPEAGLFGGLAFIKNCAGGSEPGTRCQ